MEYPGDYNISVFPEGKPLAIARFMGIGSLFVFALIIVSCGLILWTSHSRTIDPIILTTDNLTGQWEFVEKNHEHNSYSIEDIMQIHTISKFVKNWFLIMSDARGNEERWSTQCQNTDCIPSSLEDMFKGETHMYGDLKCTMYCMLPQKLFESFVTDVLPDYQARVAFGEYWKVNMETLRINPTNTNNLWQVTASVVSKNIHSTETTVFDIVAYAMVKYDDTRHLGTGGYFVEQFNSYKVNSYRIQ